MDVSRNRLRVVAIAWRKAMASLIASSTTVRPAGGSIIAVAMSLDARIGWKGEVVPWIRNDWLKTGASTGARGLDRP